MTVTSGRKCLELSQKSDQIGSLARMCLESSNWHSTMCYLTWKASATPANRLLFRLVPSMPRIKGTGCGLWPTPTATDGTAGSIISEADTYKVLESGALRKITRNGTDGSIGLGRAVRLWPTPQARDYRSGDEPDSIRAQRKREQGWSPNLNVAAKGGGQLNPDWVEQLMGFPVGWTDLDCDEQEATPFPAPLGCDQYPWEQPRVATGIKERTNRLKALGNAVVPQIPFIIGSCIMEIEGGINP
jgi:hypothetical protein